MFFLLGIKYTIIIKRTFDYYLDLRYLLYNKAFLFYNYYFEKTDLLLKRMGLDQDLINR